MEPADVRRSAIFWRFHPVGLQGRRRGPRDLLESLRRLPPRSESRSAIEPELPVLSRTGRCDHLQQDRVVAQYDGAVARLADRAADSVHLLRTLAVQAPKAARLLRHRERSVGTRSELI